MQERSKKMKKLFSISVMIVLFSLLCAYASAGVPQYVNYQGKLTDDAGGLIVNDTVSIRFRIYTDSTGGSTLWDSTYSSVIIVNGLFSVLLGPIPDSVFEGSIRYLGIKVENDSEAAPRKPFVSVGYAYEALRADTADYSRVGAPDNDWTFRITDTADTTLMTGGAWGIARYGNILYGNADSTHVNLGVACTTGATGQNRTYTTIAGGLGNTASNWAASVGGGINNIASGDRATVGGGHGNTADGYGGTIGGGGDNTTSVQYYNTIGGGEDNSATGGWASVTGGKGNTASGVRATVGGGFHNTANMYEATVGGGFYNTASQNVATVGGGTSNTASGAGATVGGGGSNVASGVYATAVGGNNNNATADYSTVGGGYYNTADGDKSFAAGDHVNIGSDADHTFAYGKGFSTSTSHAVIFYDNSTEMKVGIQTTSPGNILTVKQNSTTDPIADSWTTYSSREYKRDIRELTSEEYADALDKVLSVPVVRFHYKGHDTKEKIGIIAEEAPGEILAEGNDKAISMNEYISLLHAALKAQQNELDVLKAKLDKLESGR